MKKSILGWVKFTRYQILTGFMFLVAGATLFGFKLGSFVRTDSVYETTQYLHIDGLDALLNNVALAPIKFLELVMVKIDDDNVFLLRLVSLFFVMISALIFYRLVRHWHTARIAMFSTALYMTSSYTLHTGRFTAQDAMLLLAIPSLLLAGTWLKSKQSVNKIIIALPGLAILLYIPGFIWLGLILTVIFRKRLKLAWRATSLKIRGLSVGLATILILPLGFSILHSPAQFSQWIGFDRVLNNGLSATLDRLASIPDELFWSGPEAAYNWLLNTAILDLGTIILFLIGVFAYYRGVHTLRARLLLISLILSVTLIATSTILTIALLLPLIYLLVANGVAYMLQSWFTVFPRNPFARKFGISILIVTVGLIAVFHVDRYFVAWPQAPETVKALKIPRNQVLQ